MKKNKSSLRPGSAKIWRLPLKLLIIAVIIFAILYFIAVYLSRVLNNSDYFKVKNIIISPSSVVDLSYLKGHSMITLDLQKESEYLSREFPKYRKISLTKILPNCLKADFIERNPLAYLRLFRYFYIDQDQVIFEAPGFLEKTNLPVITGLETKIFSPRSGKRYGNREITVALEIIKEIEKNKVFRDYKIKKVDVVDINNISILLLFPLRITYYSREQVPVKEEGLEIKIGQNNLKDKINILSNLLVQISNELDKIKYIDLRFKAPVIKLRDK